jgi:hypothetical protein
MMSLLRFSKAGRLWERAVSRKRQPHNNALQWTPAAAPPAPVSFGTLGPSGEERTG